MLYEHLTLNTADFKTSRYVQFTTATGDFSNVSLYSGSAYTPKFYKLKLFHQLNNGYLDLTDDIWKKYIAWPTKNSTHWCSDTSFKYYCPSQFKGRLVSSVQIEDLYKFQLHNIPTFEINNDLSYNLTVIVDNSLKVNIIPTNGCVKIFKLLFEYTIDGVKQTPDIEVLATIANIYGNISITNIIIPNISAIYKDKILEYKITPKIGITGGDYYNGVLPIEFLENYTILGRSRITTDFDGVKFIPMLNNTSCDLVNVTRINNEYVLADDNGNLINPAYNPSTIPYVFIRNGYVPQDGATILGTYDVIDFKPKLDTPWLNLADTVVLNMFEQIVVEVNDPSCATIIDNHINLTLNFNDLSEDTTIEVLQTGYPNYNLVGFNDSPATLDISIIKDVNTTINILRNGFENIIIANTGFIEDTELNIAMIASIGFYDIIYQDNSFNYWIEWPTTSLIPDNLSLSYFIGTDPYPTGSSLGLSYTTGIGYSSSQDTWQPTDPTIISRTLENGINLSTTYYNIAIPSNYAMIGSIIFPKQI